MAYINKDTYEILLNSDIDGYLHNYFEVDELIAPTIQELNRKGYKTTFSCSGHPFIEIFELFVKKVVVTRLIYFRTLYLLSLAMMRVTELFIRLTLSSCIYPLSLITVLAIQYQFLKVYT